MPTTAHRAAVDQYAAAMRASVTIPLAMSAAAPPPRTSDIEAAVIELAASAGPHLSAIRAQRKRTRAARAIFTTADNTATANTSLYGHQPRPSGRTLTVTESAMYERLWPGT